MNRFFLPRFAAAALGALTLSGTASASDCNSSFYSQYESCLANSMFCSPYNSPQEFVAAHPACFPGGPAASTATVAGSSFAQVGAISGNVSSRMLGNSGPLAVAAGPVEGMAAGGKNAWNLWSSATANDTRQQYRVAGNVVKNDMNLANVVIGADYALMPGMVLGLSAAFDRGDGSSQPGLAAARQTTMVKGWAVAPYVGYQINKELAVDATMGVGFGTNTGVGGSETEGTRMFYAANLNYSRWMDKFQVSAKAGFLYGEEDFENTKVSGNVMAGTAVKSRMTRYQLGLQAGYWLGNGIQPYAGVSYLGDTRGSSAVGIDPIGGSAWQWALGLNFFSLASGVTGGIAYTQEDGRTNQKNSALSVNIGMRY